DRAARDGATGYAPNAGIPPLREALAAKLRTVNGVDAAPDEVVVTPGGMGAIFGTLRVLADPGDEVLIPDPGWPNFAMAAGLLGLRARGYPLRAEDGFVPDVAALDALIGPRTRVLVLVSPSNPLGTVVPPETARALVELCERRGIWLLCDHVYDQIVFEGDATSVAAIAPSDHVVAVHSFSKVHAMCGWRVGYVRAPRPVAERLEQVQEAITSSVNLPAQHAALEAVTGPQDHVGAMVAAYRARRDAAVAALADAGLPAPTPAGAFYVWIDVSAAGMPSDVLVPRLLEEEGVALAPGTAFGTVGREAVRLSLAASEADVLAGVAGLARFVGRAAAAR
ncbi:pyridoxal phosphate-dependent aminotransferase, partial [Patulibacter sp. S7RM1-6]